MTDPDEEFVTDEMNARGNFDDLSGGVFQDLTLREEIGEALAFQEDVDASQVDVDVKNGVVTVFGDVASEREKSAVVDCVSEISGVITVIDQLEIRPH